MLLPFFLSVTLFASIFSMESQSKQKLSINQKIKQIKKKQLADLERYRKAAILVAALNEKRNLEWRRLGILKNN